LPARLLAEQASTERENLYEDFSFSSWNYLRGFMNLVLGIWVPTLKRFNIRHGAATKRGSQGGFVKDQSNLQDSRISSSNGSSTIAYLVAGLGIGAAVSLLLAPKSGADTRQWIANKCLDGLDTANKSVRHTRRQVKDMMDQGQEKISEVIEAGREAIGKS
jgi:gas vesicle protein